MQVCCLSPCSPLQRLSACRSSESTLIRHSFERVASRSSEGARYECAGSHLYRVLDVALQVFVRVHDLHGTPAKHI